MALFRSTEKCAQQIYCNVSKQLQYDTLNKSDLKRNHKKLICIGIETTWLHSSQTVA